MPQEATKFPRVSIKHKCEPLFDINIPLDHEEFPGFSFRKEFIYDVFKLKRTAAMNDASMFKTGNDPRLKRLASWVKEPYGPERSFFEKMTPAALKRWKEDPGDDGKKQKHHAKDLEKHKKHKKRSRESSSESSDTEKRGKTHKKGKVSKKRISSEALDEDDDE